ncbi:hypothetical protein B0H10DRAFT_1786913, partial [Mycena sp. CBHHK59/15]
MLAKGLCFTCGEPGHLSRNCPKNQSVPSKKKGKPPGLTRMRSDLGVDSVDEDAPRPLATYTRCTLTDSSEGCSEITDLVRPGDEGETFEDRLKLWPHVSQECCRVRNNSEVPPRARRLGDVLGNTVSVLLEFFQPYPGDERIAWSDDRREKVRFRVLRVKTECFAIEYSYFDEVITLPLEYVRVPSFHLLDWYARQRAIALSMEY